MTKNSTGTPLSHADFYKLSHKKFMVDGVTTMYANLTPRSAKRARWTDWRHRAVFVGLQRALKDFFIREFNEEFFDQPKATVIAKLKRRCDNSLGVGAVDMAHFEALHDLGYLPLRIKALPEGSKVEMKVPLLTVENTHPDFAWLVTYVETVLSCEVWPTVTAATTAYQFLGVCNRYADETVGNRNHVMFQCHDFSNRGMMGRQAASITGLGHLACFSGTDTISAIDTVEDYYGVPDGYFIAGSVPASEHSVTSLGSSVEGEYQTLKRWITEAYPTGIVSIVSDTYDYWNVLTTMLPALAGDILVRQPSAVAPGKVVIRPDSGDPVRIICGYRDDEIYRLSDGRIVTKESWLAPHRSEEELTFLSPLEVRGSIDVLYGVFGGTVNKLGYKELDPHIGLIYGDSITLDRADEILNRLQQRGYASNNVVFGVGSFAYQMVTRDTLGIAVKATYAVVNGEQKELYKDPKTDDGTKKSARGLLRVEQGSDGFVLFDQQSDVQEMLGALRIVFEDSNLVVDETFDVIRNRVHDIQEPAA